MSTPQHVSDNAARTNPEVIQMQAKEESEQATIILGPIDTQDCVVNTNTQTFHVQRNKLASASPFFHSKLFSHDGQVHSILNLHGLAVLPVRILLLWIYNRIDVTNLPLIKLMTNTDKHADEAVIDTLMQTASLAQEWAMPTLLEHALFATERALHTLDPDTAISDFLETVLEKAFSDEQVDAPFDRLRKCLLDSLQGPWQHSRFANSSYLTRTIDETPALAAALAHRAFPPPAVPRYVVASCAAKGCPARGADWAFGVVPPHDLDVSCPHCVFCGATGLGVALREFDRHACGPFTLVRSLNHDPDSGDVWYRAPGGTCACAAVEALLVSLPPVAESVRLFCVFCGRH